MKITIVVCTYNRMDFLPRCLEALAHQSLSYDNYEVVIVNNNSPDHTETFCREFIAAHPQMNIRYELEKQQGLSHARNRGLAVAQAPLVGFIDDDAIIRFNYLQELVSFFEANSEVAAVGGRIYPLFETQKPAWMSSYLLDITSSIDLGDHVREFPSHKYPIGANMCLRQQIFDTIPVFNTQLGRKGDNLEGGEEKELFRNIRAAGFKIYYLPSAEVDHCVPAKRLTNEFFKRYAGGVGCSERVRTRNIGTQAYLKRLVLELYKWAGTLVLCLVYTIKLKPKQGLKLVSYRWYISKGLLGQNIK